MGKKASRNFFILGTAICTAVFIWLTIDTHTTIPKRTNTDQLTDEVIQGKRVWHKHNCNDCHTILGIGGYYSPDVTKTYSTRGEAWLKAFLKNPENPDPKRRKMPNLNLSENEINRLIVFFKWVDAIDTNQWPPQPIAEAKMTGIALEDKPRTLLGKSVYDQFRCDLCHKIGDKGGTIGPELTHVGKNRDTGSGGAESLAPLSPFRYFSWFSIPSIMSGIKDWKSPIDLSFTGQWVVPSSISSVQGFGGFAHTLPVVNRWTHGTQVTASHGHMAFFGAYAMVILTVIFYALPKLKGLDQFNQKRGFWIFWITTISMVVMGLAFGVAGVLQSYMWRGLGMDFLTVQGFMRPWFMVVLLGGFGLFAGVIIYIISVLSLATKKSQ